MAQEQQDRVDADNFIRGWMASALMLADPSDGEVPGRRARLRLVIGLVPAVLVLFGFGVYWWIFPWWIFPGGS